MRAGPKGAVSVDPLDFSHYPADRAERRLRFIAEYLRIPKGVGAGEPMMLADWQQQIIRAMFADGIRTGLVSVARGNGKSALSAALALAELFIGPSSAEALVVASDERQARIVLRMAKRMVELNPELADRCHVYQDKIVTPHSDGLLLPLPADPGALHGYDPSLLIVDELHVVTEKTWEAVTSASGKRPESLTLAISTPASSPDSIMWRLVEHGRDRTDSAFQLIEYAAPDGCATSDREAWKTANPALQTGFLAEDGLEAARKTLREPVFRQLRLGQWVSGVDAWLPFGIWDECADLGRTVGKRDRITLAFDGSASGDSTALIGCTITDPYLFVVGLWENDGDPRWRVPRGDVDRAVNLAFDRYDVAELAADPWGWRSEIESWADRHGEKRVVEWNTAFAGRMAPATDRMYQAITDRKVSHDGDPRMAHHFAHAVAKSTPQGDLIHKDKRYSSRKIDAAVAAIVALDRAAWHANHRRRRVRSFVA